MAFNLGKPILLMTCFAVASGAVALSRGNRGRADLTVWVFAESHAVAYREDLPDGTPAPIEQFRAETGKSVDVKLIGTQALNVRLNSIFERGDADGDVPDLAEAELGVMGRFFRPPTELIGFLPLNGYLEKSGLKSRLSENRLAMWSKDGQYFGIPHDVHPVSLTYRKDLFDEAGVDLAAASTWPELQEKCLAFQAYWTAHGLPQRRAVEMARSTADGLLIMLLQRRINLLDTDYTTHFTDPKVAETVAFYAGCVAGPRRIGAPATPGTSRDIRDLVAGDVCAQFTPDWRAGAIKQRAGEIAGRLRMMPLPRFDPGDAPTATWGGTMIGIPRQSKNPDLAWKLIEKLYLSPEGRRAQQFHTGILSPFKDGWSDPIWHEPDAFFGGQKVGELYIQLADQIPKREINAFSSFATQALVQVMTKAIDHIESGRPEPLGPACEAWLREADAEVRRYVDFGRFEP